ncbi:MAG: hypothetical protein PHU23_19350 [Dehalococcoidales bacterium]|nr:hypothetical protein [Dehalococcoidales bacterium]
MSKKSPVKKPKLQTPETPTSPEESKTEESQPETPETEPQETPSAYESPIPEPAIEQPVETPTPIITLESLHQEIENLKLTVSELQQTLARKRKPPVSNGKVQILDKKTGEIYPSKNNAYQTLLKSGELKELVDKDIFGDNPQRNTFGWYVLKRVWPDRFEELHEEKEQAPEQI